MARSRPITPWLFGLAALALAALAVVWLLGRGGHVEDPGAAPLSDARSGPAPGPELPDADGPRPEPPPTPPDTRRLGTIIGRLITHDRRPVPQARVRSATGTQLSVPGLGVQTMLGREGAPDEDGRFRITELPETGDLLLQVTGPDFALTEAGPYLVVAGEATDVGDVVVDPGMNIVGSVVDERDKPVAGARVRFYQAQAVPLLDQPHDIETSSDERGLFRIPYVRVAPFTLRVTASGYANARLPDFVRPDTGANEWSVKVRLRRTSPLVGTVVAKDGRPIAGATVEAVPMDRELDGGRALTDAEGRFEIADIAAGNYVVAAVAEGYAKRSERTWADAYDQPLRIVLPKQGTLSGTVVDADGRPVRHFELQARFHLRKLDPPDPRFGVRRVASDDGSFTVRNLDAGFWCVQVWAQGYALTESACVKVPQGRDVGGLVVPVKRGATLVGRVTTEDGAPVPGARVSLHTNREPDIAFLRDTEEDPTLPPAVRTRPDGGYRFTGLAERPYQLEVDHPDYALVRRDDVQALAGEESEVEPVALVPGATISGTALTAGGIPVPGASVYLTGLEGASRGGQATTDGRGRFTFTRLLPGKYQLACYGKSPSLGSLLSAGIGENRPEPFLLQRGERLTTSVVATD